MRRSSIGIRYSNEPLGPKFTWGGSALLGGSATYALRFTKICQFVTHATNYFDDNDDVDERRIDRNLLEGEPSGPKVLFATTELAPLVKVGGLSEASSGLVGVLRTMGALVELVMPTMA